MQLFENFREDKCHPPWLRTWISWVIKIELKQSHCSYSCTQNIQNSFALLFEVNIVDE